MTSSAFYVRSIGSLFASTSYAKRRTSSRQRRKSEITKSSSSSSSSSSSETTKTANKEEIFNPHKCKSGTMFTTINGDMTYDHRFEPNRKVEDLRMNQIQINQVLMENQATARFAMENNLVKPISRRVLFPDTYDEKREKPYPMVICVPGQPGYGLDELFGEDDFYGLASEYLEYEGMVSALKELDYHNENDCMICDLCFNTHTWMNDSISRNHESYFINKLLPELLGEEAINVGRISLIGYGTSGYGVLSLLYRHPDVFHRAVSADAPIWGGSNEGRDIVREGYLEASNYQSPEDMKKMNELSDTEEEKNEKKRRRALRYYDAFPDCGESFPDEYKVLLLAHSSKNIEQFSEDPKLELHPRLALIPMKNFGREVEWLSDAISKVTTHDVLTGHEDEEAEVVGPWLLTALDWLKQDL